MSRDVIFHGSLRKEIIALRLIAVLGRQSFSVARGGSSKGSMQMGQIFKISSFWQQNSWTTLLPKSLEEIENDRATEGIKVSIRLPSVTHMDTPRTAAKVECEPWRTQLKRNWMHLHSFVQKSISSSSIYLTHLYKPFPTRKPQFFKILKRAYSFSAATNPWNHGYPKMSPKTVGRCFFVLQGETIHCPVICQAAVKLHLE